MPRVFFSRLFLLERLTPCSIVFGRWSRESAKSLPVLVNRAWNLIVFSFFNVSYSKLSVFSKKKNTNISSKQLHVSFKKIRDRVVFAYEIYKTRHAITLCGGTDGGDSDRKERLSPKRQLLSFPRPHTLRRCCGATESDMFITYSRGRNTVQRPFWRVDREIKLAWPPRPRG